MALFSTIHGTSIEKSLIAMTKAVARYNSDTFDERSINEIEASALLGFFWESL